MRPAPEARAPFLGAETLQRWTERIRRDAAEVLRVRHPGVEVITEQAAGIPAGVLLAVARGVGLLVLGSRALSGLAGFVVGSVGQSVIAASGRRWSWPGRRAGCRQTPRGPGRRPVRRQGLPIRGRGTGHRPPRRDRPLLRL
ncbi:universal stress protein [Streptomyces sp. NPDC093065]|uniref:universal stress protein n=1 Tax=Streptomyces sp. NPDC093065 TaxID=3366021 RepID=UPI003819CFBC